MRRYIDIADRRTKMPESRIYTRDHLQVSANISLDVVAIGHLQKVLRLRTGAMIALFNGDGFEYQGQLVKVQRNQIQVQIIAKSIVPEPDPILKLHLVLGISRGERMDFALQKAVELGVTRITPLLAQRGVVQLKGERIERRHRHWWQVVVAACEQSGRCVLPQLDEPQMLEQAIGSFIDNSVDHNLTGTLRLVLYHLGTTKLHQISSPVHSVILLVGPEGGLSPEELDFAQQQGFLALSLGPRILRTETAPLAALAALQTLWGDF